MVKSALSNAHFTLADCLKMLTSNILSVDRSETTAVPYRLFLPGHK